MIREVTHELEIYQTPQLILKQGNSPNFFIFIYLKKKKKYIYIYTFLPYTCVTSARKCFYLTWYTKITKKCIDKKKITNDKNNNKKLLK